MKLDEVKEGEAGQVSVGQIHDLHTRTYQNEHFITSENRPRLLGCQDLQRGWDFILKVLRNY